MKALFVDLTDTKRDLRRFIVIQTNLGPKKRHECPAVHCDLARGCARGAYRYAHCRAYLTFADQSKHPEIDGCPAPIVSALPPIRSYAALGDSYAGGFGSLKRLAECASDQDLASATCTTTACGKDIGAYGYQFAATHSIPLADFAFLACAGANTSTLVASQLASPEFRNPDLVTVQIGGNDFSVFSSLILNCVYSNDTTSCQSAVSKAGAEQDDIIQDVDNALLAVNKRVSSTTNKVLLGYLQFFSHKYEDCVVVEGRPPVSGDAQRLVNELVVQSNQRLSQIAAARGFLYTTADDAYDGHRWCDDVPWWIISTIFVEGTDPSGKNYSELALGHPTAQGQNAYLAALDRVLGYS